MSILLTEDMKTKNLVLKVVKLTIWHIYDLIYWLKNIGISSIALIVSRIDCFTNS